MRGNSADGRAILGIKEGKGKGGSTKDGGYIVKGGETLIQDTPIMGLYHTSTPQPAGKRPYNPTSSWPNGGWGNKIPENQWQETKAPIAQS